MATANTDAEKTKWTVPAQSITVSKAGTTTGKTTTLSTAGTFVDRNIEIAAPTVSVADGAITAKAPTVTNGSASMAATGITTSATATDYYVTLTTTAGTAKSEAGVGTAGWVETADTATSDAATVAVDGNGTKLYIPAATVSKTSLGYGESATIGEGYTKGGTISSGVTAGTITASSPTITPTIGSTATDGKYPITGSAQTSVNVGTAGYVSSTVGTKNTGTASISGTVAQSTLSATSITPGAEQVVTIGAGYYPDARSVTVKAASTGKQASLKNTATDGVTYADGSSTAPVLVSGSYLFIDAGYLPNTKISLAKLVPDGASGAAAIKAGMLSSVSAYDSDGKLVTGNIPTKKVTDLTVDGKTVTVPTGYYATDVSKSVADGAYSVTATATKDNAQATYGTSVASSSTSYTTTGITTTQPTSGVYLTIAPTISTTAGTAKADATATVGTAGYIAAGSKNATQTSVSVDVTTTKGDTRYIPVFTGTYTVA